ncbi:MAG: Histidinol dehydrogenase [Alphaproteobacteria bacterium MarineAlpha4_Bin2]|nr:MAG: Histidinol dehydrogenase [Alphaproteobacteria bacterium MarineAlpha4_Bin2]
MPLKLNTVTPEFKAKFEAFVGAKRETNENVDAVVASVIDAVRREGDNAVAEFTHQFDRLLLTPEEFRMPPEFIFNALKECDAETIEALEIAAKRIRAFHELQVPETIDYQDAEGVRLGARWTPVDAAGLYVPGGTAAYPSSVLMNAIPAIVAGVERIVIVVPTPDGLVNPLVLAAAHIVGVEEVYRIGGAQAVAALAYGTETIRPVDKIVGPGNAYVAAAKRRVFGVVGIDLIAGPSEILVVADSKNNPDWIACDLLSQAEHDTAAQSVLITDSVDFADKVMAAVEERLKHLPRSQIAAESWLNQGAVIVVEKLEEAVKLVDRIAPEHLELAVDTPEDLASEIRHAGAVFLGRYTPEAIGDYVAGPNHVLPTSRSARYSSGLGVSDFMKRTTFAACDKKSLARIGPAAATLAKAEGLNAHALSVMVRLNS